MIKDSDEIVRNNQVFFEKIRRSSIQNIYSYGFSYSSVDEAQIEELCASINEGKDASKIVWYFNVFDEKNQKARLYEEIIRRLGF